MLPVKLPYYANTPVTFRTTKCGVQEMSIPSLYDTPLQGKIIWRVDCLTAIHADIPEVLIVNRDVLYRLIAGYEEDLEILESLYRSQPDVRKIINDLYHYGDPDKSISESYLSPMRDMVESYKCSVLERMKNTHNKYLTQTHYYIYYSIWNKDDIPDDIGGVFIC